MVDLFTLAQRNYDFFLPSFWTIAKDEEFMEKFRASYLAAKPFPHCVINKAFHDDLLSELVSQIPKPDPTWWAYNNPLEKKFAKNDLYALSPLVRLLAYQLMDSRFLGFLESLTDIPGLIPDPHLNGGGIHQITRGGKLDLHADYNYAPITQLDRRLNVLVYLNKDWEDAWGGALELWDKDVTECSVRIKPIFNRMVIFSTTDTAFHGHPDPLDCPDGVTRKSLAFYYYSNGRPEAEQSPSHSTIYKARPSDPPSQELEELRKQRAIRRLT